MRARPKSLASRRFVWILLQSICTMGWFIQDMVGCVFIGARQKLRRVVCVRTLAVAEGACAQGLIFTENEDSFSPPFLIERTIHTAYLFHNDSPTNLRTPPN